MNGWGLKVVLRERDRNVTLFEARGDTFMSFAHVVWPKNGDAVGVFVCRGGDPVNVAYDRMNRRQVPFVSLQKAMAADIRAIYHPVVSSASDDALFRWACNDGETAFLKRYPNAKVREP